MAHFYGELRGNRGLATRLGTKNSGVITIAASWTGAVETELWWDEITETNMVRVTMIPWRNKGTRRILFEGPISGE